MTAQKSVYVDLGKHVADKTILDRNDRYVGKVDDLVLELDDSPTESTPLPDVVCIVTGPFALARHLPGPLRAIARAIYRLVGVDDPRPVEIPWDEVSAIDVVVHADVDRRDLGVMALSEAVDRAIIARLPGAGVRP